MLAIASRIMSLRLMSLPLLLTLASRPVAAQHAGHAGHEAAPAKPAPAKPALARTADGTVRRPAPAVSKRVVQNGVILDVTMGRAVADSNDPAILLTHEDLVLGLRLTDEKTGEPLAGREIGAWIDAGVKSAGAAAASCKTRINQFVQGKLFPEGSIKAHADVDLNGYFLLTLNTTPNITVIDPVKGFGRTKLYTTVPLPAIGEDWALDDERGVLYVSLPSLNQLAVVNTADWKVARTIPTATLPGRLAMQPGTRNLWVMHSGADATTVTVIDLAEARTASTIKVGAGAHALAFSTDGQRAFVTNAASGTVTIIDAERLVRLAERKVGPHPVDVSYSAAARAAFVADAVSGAITRVDPVSFATRATVVLAPGLGIVRFPPQAGGRMGGHAGHTMAVSSADRSRYGFVTNPSADRLYIFDATTGKVLRNEKIGDSPDKITFTQSFAYIRSLRSSTVSLISLDAPVVGGLGRLDHFEAGSAPPSEAKEIGVGAAIVSAPEMHDAVYVLNPKERMVYYYHYMEGMPIPSGGVTTYGFQPKSVLVTRRVLRETAPGEYTATARLTARGTYDIVFLLDDPRVTGCVEVAIKANPAAYRTRSPIEATLVDARSGMQVGENRLRFQLMDALSGQPRDSIPDLVAVTITPAGWQARMLATRVGAGLYEVVHPIPAPGNYYLSLLSASAGLRATNAAPFFFAVDRPGARAASDTLPNADKVGPSAETPAPAADAARRRSLTPRGAR
ncbi:MAG: YncE family protein [Gemmatimonadaceae bacterium]